MASCPRVRTPLACPEPALVPAGSSQPHGTRTGTTLASRGSICLAPAAVVLGDCTISAPHRHLGAQAECLAAAYDRRVSITVEPSGHPSLPLLVLGQGRDLATERGVECPGELPAPSDPGLVERARAAKAALGERVFVLGHHYQRDEVIEFADVTGDSFKLAKEAAARPDAPFIVFCGVHFMAESADILTAGHQQVVLPDLAAGCSMADMAAFNQVEDAWADLVEMGIADLVIPVTYMNSSAAIKAFTGRHGGTICTSGNAKSALQWAFDQRGGVRGQGKVLFLPDQHLGRNTAVRELGLSLQDCVVFDPHKPAGGLSPEQVSAARVILWRGHCSVHGRFSLEAIEAARATIAGVKVIVHPECQYDVVQAADEVGSTEKIIATIAAAPDGTSWAVGTELNLVRRLATMFPRQNIAFLEKNVCYCSTMNRIDLPHMVWALESLVSGRVVNQIRVDPDVAKWARVALDQMLALPGESAKD
jgi:quinolinate synthase